MKSTSARSAAIALVSAIALAGCDELQGQNAGATGEPAAVAALGPGEKRTETRDVERPDVFSVTETGLWDGRPSLGGIWIAHPDVKDPERANITNTKSGKTISGALFRRERANPGPRIQVSSDAAAALGMLAGQPAELKIVAVRQETIEIEPEPLPIAEDASPAAASDTAAAEEPDTEDTAVAAAAGAAAGAATAAEAADTSAKPGFWARFRDSLRNKPADAAGEGAALAETAESAAVPEVETAPLDPVATSAAAAIDRAEDTDAKPASAPQAKLKNPFIQVGLFSQEENASAAAASLRQAGIVPEIRGQGSGGKRLWRVFVGPISSAEDQSALLKQIRDLGYKDAFAAPN